MSLEDDFKKVVEENGELIDEKIAKASELLSEAIAIAEKTGIPFYASVSHIGQNYTPESFEKKWGDVSPDILDELDIYVNEYGGGWEHSAVC